MMRRHDLLGGDKPDQIEEVQGFTNYGSPIPLFFSFFFLFFSFFFFSGDRTKHSTSLPDPDLSDTVILRHQGRSTV